MDIAMLVRKGARRYADRTAVMCDGSTQTYRALHERSSRLANALAGLGLRKGERVATLTDNSPEALELAAGLALGGYVRSALYTHNDPETNVYLLGLVEASAVLVQSRHHAAIAAHLASVTSVRHVIVFDGEATDGALDYETLLADASPEDPRVPVALDDPFIVRFSAGTTGRPKGILHTVEHWAAVGTEMGFSLPPLGREDRYLAAGPLAHAAQMPLPPVLDAGGTVVVMRAFEPGAFLELIARERCTVTFGVPAMVIAALDHPAAATTDVSSLRAFVYGGAPMTETTVTRARETFGEVMYQLYGQSEGAPLTFLRPEDHVDRDGRWVRSAGRETPNCEIRIFDDEGRELPTGEVGEIGARTTTALAEIWRDPDATAARLLPDGTVLTRDMGYVDEDGFLFITDRKEDMIISGGHNVWPAELENALAAHPAVGEVAVAGIPHPRWGETPLALVVLRDGTQATEEELVAWTREKVGSVKKVTCVRFADALPRTPIGKVLRRVVSDTYADAASEPAADRAQA